MPPLTRIHAAATGHGLLSPDSPGDKRPKGSFSPTEALQANSMWIDHGGSRGEVMSSANDVLGRGSQSACHASGPRGDTTLVDGEIPSRTRLYSSADYGMGTPVDQPLRLPSDGVLAGNPSDEEAITSAPAPSRADSSLHPLCSRWISFRALPTLRTTLSGSAYISRAFAQLVKGRRWRRSFCG